MSRDRLASISNKIRCNCVAEVYGKYADIICADGAKRSWAFNDIYMNAVMLFNIVRAIAIGNIVSNSDMEFCYDFISRSMELSTNSKIITLSDRTVDMVDGNGKLSQLLDHLKLTQVDCSDTITFIKNFDNATTLFVTDFDNVTAGTFHSIEFDNTIVRTEARHVIELLSQISGMALLHSHNSYFVDIMRDCGILQIDNDIFVNSNLYNTLSIRQEVLL